MAVYAKAGAIKNLTFQNYKIVPCYKLNMPDELKNADNPTFTSGNEKFYSDEITLVKEGKEFSFDLNNIPLNVENYHVTKNGDEIIFSR